MPKKKKMIFCSQGLSMATDILTLLFLCSSLFPCNEAGIRHDGRPGASGGATFNVMKFGAKPGKEEESTQAFIKAWRATCNCKGKATLLIPPGVYRLGETIFVGPCQNPVMVLVQGTLQAVTDISDFAGGAWISFEEIDGLVLTGGGTFDGQGQAEWEYDNCNSNPNCIRLPASIHMSKVNHAMIRQINMINGMGFHIHISRCKDIHLQRLTITAPGDSPNTDGIHISKSYMIKVSRSVMKSGDACVSIGPGSNNVTISQITCGPGHGISVGSLGKLPDELDVRGLIVKNCTLVGTKNGIQIKTYLGSEPSTSSGFLFQDIVLDNVENPIIIDQSFGSKSTEPSRVKIDNVVYQNIRGTTESDIAVSLMCSSKVPCKDLHLHNINLRSTGGGGPKSVCRNAEVRYTGTQNPPPCKL